MALISLSVFSGALPVKDLRTLPDMAAVQAVNTDLDGGALKGIRGKRLIKALNPATKYVYKLPYNSGGNPIVPSNMQDARWLEFTDINTNVLRAPTVNDGFKRYYWASPSTGLKYSTLQGLLDGTPPLDVGVEAPLTALAVTPVGGTIGAPTVTRSYLATFVSIYGEEGQPGPTIEAVGKVDDTWTITSIDQPVNAVGDTEVDRIRIYRTITAASGVTTFFLVTTLTVGATVYADNLTDSTVSANPIIEGTLWAPPPAGLQGIVAMPNGIFVGWVGNTLYFSENFRPHAWPAEYALSVQFPIVGLGVFGTTCVVCTEGNPATVTGIRASTMALTQGRVSMPCTSRLGIVSTLSGVYYPSSEGLVIVGPQGADVVTKEVISKSQWGTDYLPTTLKSFFHRQQYYALRTTDGFALTGAGVVDIDLFTAPVMMGTDEFSGNPWLIDGGYLYEWECAAEPQSPFRWRSKEWHVPRQSNMSVTQLMFDTPVGNELAVLRVWADRRLVFDQSVQSAREVRLPSGFKADIWQFEVESPVRVHRVNIANTIAELRNG
jgi:hypothetical protein